MKKRQQKHGSFDLMNYFSVMRITVALLLSILIVFVIIFFVSQTPGLAIRKLMLGPLETKRSFFNVVVRAIPLVFTGLGLTLWNYDQGNHPPLRLPYRDCHYHFCHFPYE